MKNLLIYLNPVKKFDEESDILIKVQIDNSLALGWKLEDILLVTNFSYEYNGVKSLVIEGSNYCEFYPTVSKVNAIINLFEKGIIKQELYWFHDIDAYQVDVINEFELEFDKIDMALTDYGRNIRWATGSIFFKRSSKDIFNLIKEHAYKYKIDEEHALMWLTENLEKINDRIKKLNISYNFHFFNVRSNFKNAIKPIKIIHFHPFRHDDHLGNLMPINWFMGDNKIGVKFVTPLLESIFKRHWIL